MDSGQLLSFSKLVQELKSSTSELHEKVLIVLTALLSVDAKIIKFDDYLKSLPQKQRLNENE